MRFSIAYGRLKPLLTVTAIPQSSAYVDVHDDTVSVHMSWAFKAEIPRSSIQTAELHDKKYYSIGVHGWRGRWLVNGTSEKLVRLTIDPAAPARTGPVPLKLTELIVSLDDRQGFLESLNAT